jgi:serine protease Do
MIERKHVKRPVAMALTILLGAIIPATPVSGQIPNLRTGGTVPTLAPLVREVTPAVVQHRRPWQDPS